MSMEIIQSGLLTTVQDAGRNGYRSLGIHAAGAMDTEALYLANALVGNPDQMPVLEIHFPCGRFIFHSDTCFSITGADFDPQLNGISVFANRLLLAPKGSVLSFSRPVWGARAYVAVAGGFQLESWLGSYSTDLSARAGGWKGRALTKGDLLSFHEPIQFRSNTTPAPIIRCDTRSNSGPLQLLPGPEWSSLSPVQQDFLLKQVWTVTSKSDRMGIRLKPAMAMTDAFGSMVSAPAEFGTIQWMPNGELTVLMADHPVTGGYPRVAHLPYFERSRLAQFIPGQTIQVQLMEFQQALAKDHEYLLSHRTLRESIRSAAQSYLQEHVIEC